MKRHCRLRAGVLALVAFMGAAWMAEASPVFAGPEGRIDEFRVRAAFLVKFAKFVQWPHEGALTFCVLGDDEFVFALTSIAGAERATGRDVVVRSISAKNWDFAKCDVLYIGRDAVRYTVDILKQLEALPVLTVGDSDAFLKEGGIVRVFVQDNKIRFQVSGPVAEKRGLKISSQLLSLAAH